MESKEVIVVFECDVVLKNKNQEIQFESNKEHQVNKEFFQSLSIQDLEKLTPESFWQNIKFINKNYRMNRIYKPGSGLSWPPSNKCFELLVNKLVSKHVNAAFEYLQAKRRSNEEKNIYFTSEEKGQFKNPLIVGKESLQLLYPEQKDYFDELNSNELQKEINEKLMLNTEYDKELKRGNVLRDKEQSRQINKIRKRKEENLYTELLNIDKKYIKYFSPDFLYRKIILEKSNDGKLNDFQKAFIETCIRGDCSNIIDRVQFLEYEKWFLRGWEFCKFVLEHKAKSVIEKVQLGQYEQISKKEIFDLMSALKFASSYLKKVPKDIMYKIIFNNSGIDCTIKKIVDLLSGQNFVVNRLPRAVELKEKSYYFFESLYYLIIDEEKETEEGKIENLQLDDDHKKNLLWLIGSCPCLMNRYTLESFILDNLNDENVWYTFCNFNYLEADTDTVLQHFKNKSEELIKIIGVKPDILYFLTNINKENYEFIYSLITKLILEHDRSILCSLRFMRAVTYTHVFFCRQKNIKYTRDSETYNFWLNYFAWLEKNLGTKKFLINGTQQNLTSKENNKNIEANDIKSEKIILIDNDKINESEKTNEIKIEDAQQIKANQLKSINENDLKKIILTRRYIGNDCLFYQEDYWNVNTNDFSVFLELLKERNANVYKLGSNEISKFFRIEVLRQKYVNDNNLQVYSNFYINMPPQHVKKMKKFDQLIKFEINCAYRFYKDVGYGNYKNFFEVIQDIEECDPNYSGLSELKSHLPYLILIHWTIHITIIVLSIASVAIPWFFLSWGWGLGLSFIITAIVAVNFIGFCWHRLHVKDYTWAEKLYLNKRLKEYDINLSNYRSVTNLFERFIGEKLCFIGNDIWNKIENYFKNNVLTLENELKKYREIDDFKKITLYDVYRFYWKRDCKLMSDINKIFDDTLDQKVNEINIDEISRDFRNYVNNKDNGCFDACEKFINKNIVGYLDNIKEMLKTKGRCAYFRYKPNTNEKLIQYDISHDLSELLWKTLKKEHEKDKNLNYQNEKPLGEINTSENIINTQSE